MTGEAGDLGESDEEIAEEVLPIAGTSAAVPKELDTLAPWHRPRKQFVRTHQWQTLTGRLLERTKDGPSLKADLSGQFEVRYLTLPGVDHLDVRVVAECCAKHGCALTSTGFLAGGEDNPEIARAHVRLEALIEAQHVTEKSHTLRRNFEEISDEGSQAYEEILRRGPFHIVNLDVCGSLAPPSADHPRRLIDALYRIVEMQLARSPGRWLLFLTTDARPDNFAKETLGKLNEAIRTNAASDDGFAKAACEVLGTASGPIDIAINTAGALRGAPFLKLVSLGLGKWLLHLAESKGWTVKMERSYFYSTTKTSETYPSMPCLAFEFVPKNEGLNDPYGVTKAKPATPANVKNPSMRVLEKVSEMSDLDSLMDTDATLREEMTGQTRSLLEEAGYAASALAALATF